MISWLKKIDPVKIVSSLGRWLGFWLPLFLLDSMAVIAYWLKNRNQTTIQDLVLPIAMSVFFSGVVALAFYVSYRKNRFAAMIAGVATILVGGQLSDKTIFPVHAWLNHTMSNRYAHLVMIVALPVAIILYYYFHKLTVRWKSKTNIIANAGFIIIVVAFLVQFFSFAKVAITEWPQFFYTPPLLPTNQVANANPDKPDIYYIVLDRYVSQSVLKEQFNFDNSDFLNYLTSQGFYTDPDAYSSFPFTTMSLSSTLSASYNSDQANKFSTAAYQTVQPFHDTIHKSPVIKQLKSYGYSYYHIGTWYEATSIAPLADHYFQPDGQLTLFNRRITLTNFDKNKFFKGIFHLLVPRTFSIGKFTIFSFHQEEASHVVLSSFQLLKDLAAEKSGGRFIFAHILCPHYPYYFNADGSRSSDPLINNNGKPLKQKLTDQIQFVNSQMKIIIDSINKNSQDQAIIILQSDEGEYPIYFNDGDFWLNAESAHRYVDMRTWSDKNLKQKLGILAAYHLPRVSEESLKTGADSVNIFRLVLNSYFGNNLPYLPKCHYAYPEGREKAFLFTDITQRLTGQANPACSSDAKY